MKVLVVLISLLSIVKSQKNLALNGTASQSSVYYWENQNLTADLAITGGPTHDFFSASCSVTLTNPKQYVAWWMLTFPVDTIYITNIKIYYRDNTLPRLAGYYLYISNSSVSKTDGHLCYHHTGPGLPDKLQDVNCNHIGKNVIFYNERDKDNIPTGYSDIAMLELCQVEVYGCYKGWWDANCSTPCPVNCIDDHCYTGNGSCVWGCTIGQDGDMCDRPCEPGKFGQNCADICHCINQPCDSIMGVCPPGGCTRGYTSRNCIIECSLGYYGYNCNQYCDGCLSDSCDKEHGVCTDTSGCKPGWQHGQTKCDRECDTGTYGDNCESRCDTCVNRICDRFDGQCIYGCIDGFKGHDCLLTASPQSAEQTTNDIALYVGVTGIFMATVLMCVNIFQAISRYRRKKRNGSENPQSGQKISKFVNDVFIDDYTNIGSTNTEAHYEENIQAQEQPYDSI